MSENAPRERIQTALGQYVERYSGRNLADLGAVRNVEVDGDGRVKVAITLGFPARGYAAELAADLKQVLREAGFDAATVTVDWQIVSHAVQRNLKPLAGIKNIVAVASGKGGVGKSTVSVNLALALSAEGADVGILDADIYGPSQPRMLGTTARPESKDGKRMEPVRAHGIQSMSIGYLIDVETPMVWRGPMVTQALTQLLNETHWGELDYLVVDLPPGTGDIQLTLAQRIPVSGAVIVSTPQEIALLDARKGLKMFEKVEVPVLGVIENMSTHICSNCGHEEAIFGSGGGERMAQQYHVDLLGKLPLDVRIREQADNGRPTVVADPDGDIGRNYRDIARRTAARLARGGEGDAAAFPTITMED